MRPARKTIHTAFADIAVLETHGSGTPVLLLHGNSTCKEVFRAQIEGEVGRTARLIAIDLPGHGESGNAPSAATYSIPGYADTVAAVLDDMKIDDVILLGWSLGGHVALELLQRRAGIKGVILVGAPPFGRGLTGMLRAFHLNPALLLATRARLDRGEIEQLARICFGGGADPHLTAMIARTDPKARRALFRSLIQGRGVNQREAAEQSPVPLAIINGAHEPFARIEYLESLDYDNLWDGCCHIIDDCGHAPFLEQPEAFDRLLLRYLRQITEKATVTRRSAPERRLARPGR